MGDLQGLWDAGLGCCLKSILQEGPPGELLPGEGLFRPEESPCFGQRKESSIVVHACFVGRGNVLFWLRVSMAVLSPGAPLSPPHSTVS